MKNNITKWGIFFSRMNHESEHRTSERSRVGDRKACLFRGEPALREFIQISLSLLSAASSPFLSKIIEFT